MITNRIRVRSQTRILRQPCSPPPNQKLNNPSKIKCNQNPANVILQDVQRSQDPENESPNEQTQGARQGIAAIT